MFFNVTINKQGIRLPSRLDYIDYMVGPRGSAVEGQSLAGVLSPSCARPVADG